MSVAQSQLFSSSVTACFTIIGGVTVLVLGQLAIRFFIEPIHEQSKLIAEIGTDLTFYANVLGNADILDQETVRQASSSLRRHASAIRATAWTIKWYPLWQALRLIPSRQNAFEASKQLIGLSNSMGSERFEVIHKRQEQIKDLLDFR